MLAWDAWRPYQLHPDHRAAGLAATDAVLAASNPHFFPEQITEGLSPYRVEEAYLHGSLQADVVVDITATFERKMTAIECHRIQVDRLLSSTKKTLFSLSMTSMPSHLINNWREDRCHQICNCHYWLNALICYSSRHF